MSNNRIFAGSRYEAQGRNVNLTGTMFKRNPIFNHQTVEKVQTSPFANYSCKTGQSFLSQSQTSIPQDRLTLDAVRQIVKEQLSKSHSPEETNRKLMHTLQAQITDLKQRIAEYEKENNKKIQETVLIMRQDFHSEAEKMGQDVQLQITNKLRSFFQKANIELKKDILKTAQEEFLTIAEGDDFQNRLQAFNEKIETIIGLVSTNKVASVEDKTAQPMILVQHVQAKISKLQKDLEQHKRQITDLVPKLKSIQEWKQQEVSKRNQKIIQQKIEHMKQKIKSIDYQIQKKFGILEIKQTSNEGDINILKQKVTKLQQNTQEYSALFLDFNKKLSSKDKETEGIPLSDSLSITQKQVDISLDLNMRQNTYQKQQYQTAIQKEKYQLDSEGYLMDGDKKYLLTQDNKMIKLSQEQIDVLLSSQAIQIVQN